MPISLQVLLCTVLGVLLPVDKCVSVSCDFAVNQSGPPGFPGIAKSDCSSFLEVTSTQTVTPEPSTYYVTTVTSFTTTTVKDTVYTTQTTYTSPIVQKRVVNLLLHHIPSYATACKSDQAYSAACHLLGVKPSTTTTTVTAPTPVVTASTTTTDILTTKTTTTVTDTAVACKATGISYGVYDFFDGQDAPPEEYKDVQPLYIGTTGHLSFTNQNYDSGTTDPVMELKGYIRALTAGPYTFTCNSVDDFIYFWHGDIALSGWTGDSAAFTQVVFNTDPPPTATVNLALGQFYPFRYSFFNYGGPWELSFDITGPDGTVLTDDSQGTSPYLVYDPCGAYTSFPPFGQET